MTTTECHTRCMSQDLGVRLLDPASLTSAAEQAQLLTPQLKALSDPNRRKLLLLLAESPQQVATQEKALSDPNRLHLLLLLGDRPRTVRELTEAAGISQTLVNQLLGPL